MFKHLFTLIWNKKKQNLLLMFEMLVSFLVIFAVFSLMAYYYKNYRKPMGFDYKHTWVINYNNALQTTNSDSLALFYETIRQTLLAMPQVEAVSYTSQNVPFSETTMSTGLNHQGKTLRSVNNFIVDDDYPKVLGMQLLEGRWFGKQDAAAKERPILINATMKEELFGKENAVGKYLGDYDNTNKMKVIGVVGDVKARGDYTTIGNAIFNRADTGAFRWLGNMLVKVRPDADAAFESRLYKVMAGAMKNSNVEIAHLEDMRRSKNKFFLAPLIIILIVSAFLVINVALGLFGVLWYNINRRREEIGLRRAMGASGRAVSFQLVSEALILATLSLVVGSFFAIQMPLLRVGNIESGVYLTALFFALLFIYLLVLVCSLYPGSQAAAIRPAVALHEE